ncbi:MAG: hypothetical protein HGB00_05160 [Chlorobiaceae bacterium]|nr:hypothetical protein [Chlorobiaceae bacterium]
MKKSAKLLTLAVALIAGFGTSTAQAADGGFKIGADLVSSYVWRGTEYGNSPAVQPAVSYTIPGTGGIVVGLWGSYAINGNSDRYKEVDASITFPAGPLSFTATNYNVLPNYSNLAKSKTFNFDKDGPNVVEVSAAYASGNLALLAAINVAGKDTDNAKYCEASYKFYDKDGYSAKGVAGMGNKNFYGDGSSDKFVLVNTGISVSKDRYTAAYVYNPNTEASSLVFMASF